MKYLAVILAVGGFAGVACAGGDRMEFPNKKGTVVFYHKKHEQIAYGECKVCHETPGPIEGFGKQFAHTLCVGCHQTDTGKFEGPVECDGCHSAG